jgi:hypothetical protein
MKVCLKQEGRMRKSGKLASRRSRKPSKMREVLTTGSIAPAVVVGTTEEPKPRLIVKKPVTLAEAIAEPIVDVAEGKIVSIRKAARRKRAA